MLAIVAGAAGFLGSHLVDRLLDEGMDVLGVDNLMTGSLGNLDRARQHAKFRFETRDIREGFPPGDVIFNLACPASPKHYQADPYATVTASVLGAIRLVEVARGSSVRIVHASTSEVYGDPLVHPQTESYRGNVNPIGVRACYDEGKRAAETILWDARRVFGADVRILRLFNTYGPRMAFGDGRVVSNFIESVLAGEPIRVHGNGEQSRSFCYVSDVIDAFVAMAKLPGAPDTPINVGNPVETSIRELAELVMAVAGTHVKIVHEPRAEDDPARRRPDVTKAEALLGFRPAIALRDGITRTIADFRERR